MQKLDLTITYLDGTSKVISTASSDLIKWETFFDLSIDKIGKLTHLLYLGYVAAKRLALTTDEFEVWADTIEGVEVSDPKALKP
jgi:hypothetical protein